MSPSSPPLGSQMLGPRDGVSIHSSRAGGPDRSRTEEPPPYLRVAPLMRRVQDLESRVGKLEYSVTDSFVGVRDELDEVWKDLGDVRKIRASPPQDSSSAPSLFQGRASYTASTSSNAPLMPALFQQLMRQVVDELCVAGFELRTDPDARTNPGLVADALEQTIDQVSSCSRRLVSNSRGGSSLWRIGTRVTPSSEEGRPSGILAWFWHGFRPSRTRICIGIEWVWLLSSWSVLRHTAEGMATAAAAHKAEYNSLTEARISLSFGLTYLENLMKKQDKQKHVATGGWFWTTPWSTYVAFKGTFNNGAKDSITSSLR